MSHPPIFEKEDYSLVCKLHKALYGLKQAHVRGMRRRLKLLSDSDFLIENMIILFSFTLIKVSSSILLCM